MKSAAAAEEERRKCCFFFLPVCLHKEGAYISFIAVGCVDATPTH
jgi:hypothetical protein